MTDMPTDFANALANKFVNKQYEKKADKIIIGDNTFEVQKINEDGSPVANKISFQYCSSGNKLIGLYVGTTPIYYNDDACTFWEMTFTGSSISTTNRIANIWPFPCKVDWGDGNKQTYSDLDKLTHTYTDGVNEHTIKANKKFTQMNDNAFENITNIKKIKFDELGAFGKNSFKGCTHLESIDFSSNLHYILAYAFSNCCYVKSSSIVTEYGGLNNLVFPDSLTNIYEGAFKGCYNLTKFTFGKGLESIGSYAFDMSGKGNVLSEIYEIEFTGTTPPTVLENAFVLSSDLSTLIQITVPHGTGDAYQNTPNMPSGDNVMWVERL